MANDESQVSSDVADQEKTEPAEGEKKDSSPNGAPAPQANGKEPGEGKKTESREEKILDAVQLKKALDEKEKESKELSNRLLRALADYDNVKKRAAKEVLNAMQSGSEELVRKLLPVVDSFESALRQISDKDIDKKVLEGFEMLAIQLTDVLEKEGLKAIKAKGEKFDPNLHEALMKSSNPDLDDEIVTKEFEKGYTFKEKVIRPAKVEINQK